MRRGEWWWGSSVGVVDMLPGDKWRGVWWGPRGFHVDRWCLRILMCDLFVVVVYEHDEMLACNSWCRLFRVR